jgi:hypothetical protein
MVIVIKEQYYNRKREIVMKEYIYFFILLWETKRIQISNKVVNIEGIDHTQSKVPRFEI